MLIVMKDSNPFKNLNVQQLFKKVGPRGAKGQNYGTLEECQRILREDGKIFRDAQKLKAARERSPHGTLVMQIPYVMFMQEFVKDPNFWKDPNNLARYWETFPDMRMVDTKGKNPWRGGGGRQFYTRQGSKS